MTRQTAKQAGMAVYVLLMMCIPAVLFLEMNSYIIPGVALVGLMFALAMALLWLSEKEEQPQSRDTKAREGSRQRG